MVKLIILDAYGVCLSGGYPDTCQALGKKFDRDWKELYTVIYTKYFNQAALKQVSQVAAWEKAIKELALPITLKEIEDVHFGLMGVNKEVLRLAVQLRKKYKILLLSKNTRRQFRGANERFPELKKTFGKNIINTWEYNLPKASRETMEFVMKRFGVKPKEIVYVDDQEANLVEPAKLGVKTILFKDVGQFKTELNHYLTVV